MNSLRISMFVVFGFIFILCVLIVLLGRYLRKKDKQRKQRIKFEQIVENGRVAKTFNTPGYMSRSGGYGSLSNRGASPHINCEQKLYWKQLHPRPILSLFIRTQKSVRSETFFRRQVVQEIMCQKPSHIHQALPLS